MKMKLWPIIMAIALAIVLLPAPAEAGEPVEVGGGFMLANTEGSEKPKDGTDYTYEEGVLTIKTETPLTISTTGTTSDRIVIGLDSSKTATLTLNGVNITAPAGQHALYSEEANVVLNLAEGTENTLTGGSSESGDGGYGISVGDSNNSAALTIKGSGQLTATGGDGEEDGGHGIYCENGDIDISANSTVTAIGGDGEEEDGRSGIYSAFGNIDISDSIVKALGGNGGTDGGNGLDSLSLTIETSTVTATGGNGEEYGGNGIYCYEGNLSAQSGTITATGGNGTGTAGAGGSGIYMNLDYADTANTITFGNAAVVTAEAGAGTMDSVKNAIYGVTPVNNGLLFTKTSNDEKFKAEISTSGEVTPSNDFTVPPCTLTIPVGTTLTVSEGVTMTNEGNVVVYGKLEVRGTLKGSGTIIPNGPIDVWGTYDTRDGLTLDLREDNITDITNITFQSGANFTSSLFNAGPLTIILADDSKATFNLNDIRNGFALNFTGSAKVTLAKKSEDAQLIYTVILPAKANTLMFGADDIIIVPADTTIQAGTGPAIVTKRMAIVLPNSSIILPENGTAILGEGERPTTITAPATESITLTPTAEGIAVPSDTTIQTGNSPAIVTGSDDTTVHSDGSITLPPGGTATVDTSSGQATITAPEAESITLTPQADGSLLLSPGSSVTIGDKTTELLNGGTLSADGKLSVTPSETPDTPETPDIPSTPDPAPPASSNYPVTLPTDTDHGSITIPQADRWATDGEKITITVTPDAGYMLDELTITDKAGNKVATTDNGDGTYTFTMPAAGVTIDATFVVDPDYEAPTDEPEEPDTPTLVEERYTDVSADAWYRDAVQYVVDNGIMTGTSATTFAPQTATTRAMIVSMLHRLENSPATSDTTFSDVAAGSWYADPVAWAAAEGIVGGYEDDTFQPNKSITREELASILYRYAEYTGRDTTARADLSGYTDAASPWAYDVMAWANAQGLITGRTATTIDAQATLTRAETAAIFQRFIG